jgi:alkylation response protein AidB-like acyl-CoA dehydrogenase
MDFEPTEEQSLLRDTLTRYLRERYDFDARRAVLAAGDDDGLWRALADDLGVLGAPFPVETGGLGGGAVETMLVMEALGEALAVTPYLETVVLAGSLLRQAGNDRARELLAAIAAGEARIAVAIGEPGTRFGLNGIATAALATGQGFALTGDKTVVVGAPTATHLLVLANADEELALFLTDPRAPGVAAHRYRLIDERGAADLALRDVAAERLPLADVRTAVERALDEATAALCAEAVGVLRRMLADTIDYTKQRRQFDQPLAAFQALQHRMVDMYMAVEQAVSASYLATLRLDAPAPVRSRAVSAAKVTVARALREVGQEAVQMHGAMGLTDLLPIGHYFKRATVMEHQFGSADYHIARYAALARAA